MSFSLPKGARGGATTLGYAAGAPRAVSRGRASRCQSPPSVVVAQLLGLDAPVMPVPGPQDETGERGRFTPDELLEAGTAAGYAALGWPEGGTIEVGKLADFIAVRPDSVRTAGCRPNQLLFSAAATDVRHVVVHGEHIVEDGLHRAGDVAAHLTSALKVLREAPA